MAVSIPTLETFQERLFLSETGVFDPEGVHHEFCQGLHGPKVDLDNVEEGTDLYAEWVERKAEFITGKYPRELLARTALVGVANGTNRIARDVAETISGAAAVETVKNGDGLPVLNEEAVEQLQSTDPLIALVLEDVFTRGTNSSSVVASVMKHRPQRLQRVEAIATVQRGIPERLVVLGVPYFALIKKLMKDYMPDECRRRAYCAYGWELIPYARNVDNTNIQTPSH